MSSPYLQNVPRTLDQACCERHLLNKGKLFDCDNCEYNDLCPAAFQSSRQQLLGGLLGHNVYLLRMPSRRNKGNGEGPIGKKGILLTFPGCEGSKAPRY